MSKSNGVDVIDGGGADADETRTCFLVTPIGEDGGEIRKRSDYVRTYIIDEALGPLNYVISRSDLVDASGDITEQIVSQLWTADLVIADLTGHNPNVFYELAVRHAFSKPFIHIAQKDQSLPFDIAQQRTVFYDLTDLPSVYAARASIRAAAEEILAGGDGYKVVSPVTRAVDIDSLRRSGNPEEVAIADIKQSVSDIQAVLMRLATRGPDRVLDNDGLMSIAAIFINQFREGRFNSVDLEKLSDATMMHASIDPLYRNVTAAILDSTSQSAKDLLDSASRSQAAAKVPAARASFSGSVQEPLVRVRKPRPKD